MQKPIHEVLAKVHAVRGRMRLAAAVHGGLTGLALGCALCLVFLRTRIPVLERNPLALLPLVPGLAAAVLAAAAAIGAAVALTRRISMIHAAAVIDRASGLQDRTNSAVDFISRHVESPLVELQINDADGHVHEVHATRVVRLFPGAARRRAFWSLVAVAVLAAFWGVNLLVPRPLEAVVLPDEAVIQAGRDLKEVADAVRERIENVRLKEAKELLEKLDRLAEELAQGEMTKKEVLSEVTKIQEEAEEQQAKTRKDLNSAKEDLKEAAKELQDDELSRKLAEAMRKGELKKASEEMEKFADALKERQDKRKLMRKKLRKAAEKMDAKELAKLAEYLVRASDYLDTGDMEMTEQELDMAALELLNIEDLEILEGILADIMDGAMIAKLNLGKGKLVLAKGRGGMGLRLPIKIIGPGGARKSNSPSNSAGTATDNAPFGRRTDLDAGRRVEGVHGEIGKEGKTFVEISKVAESKETGSTAYREAFSEYSKAALEALSYEKIPLGYRYYVRSYFESIRPGGGGSSPGEAEPEGAAATGAGESE